MNIISVKLPVTQIDECPEVTITGSRDAVMLIVARMSGLEDAREVSTRRSPNDDGTTVIVETTQADDYPSYLAEVLIAYR